MYKILNIKKIILLLTTLVLFFSFNIEVNAASKDEGKAGKCTYNYTADKKKFTKVRINQDKEGNIIHEYYSTDSKWINVKNSKIGSFYIENQNNQTNNNSTTCPKYGIKVSKAIHPQNGLDQEGNEIAYYDKYEGYDYVISWCLVPGVTGCRAADQTVGYFDKQNNTSASAKYQVGDCEYSNDILTVKVSQDKKGKITYKFKDGSSWKSTNKKTNKGETIKLKNKPSKGFTQCPKNVTITKNSNVITVNFENISCGYVGGKNICLAAKGTGNFEKKEGTSSKQQQYEKYTNDDLINDCKSGDDDCKYYESCEEILGKELVGKLQEVVNIVRVLIPILLIVLGTLDFGKAVFQSDENEMKKAQARFIKRLIIAIGFFLIPSVIQLLLNIAATVWNIKDPSLCGITFK